MIIGIDLLKIAHLLKMMVILIASSKHPRKIMSKYASEAREYFKVIDNEPKKEQFRAALRKLKATSLEKIVFGNDTDEIKSEYSFPEDKEIESRLANLQKEYPLILPEGVSYCEQFKEIFKITKLIADFIECNNDKNNDTAYLYAFKILILFGKDLGKFDKFLNNHNFLKDNTPVKKALDSCLLPSEDTFGVKSVGEGREDEDSPWKDLKPITNIHLEAWRKIVFDSGPKAYPYFRLAIQIEQIKRDVPHSLDDAFNVIIGYQYYNWEEDPLAARLFFELRINESVFQDAIDFSKKAKQHSNIPDLMIKGHEIDKQYNGYYLVKLPVDDLRFYILGDLTNCCQRLNGSAHDFVVHNSMDPNSDVYVLLKQNKKNKKKSKEKESKHQEPDIFQNGKINYENYKIMGQGLVWRSRRGNLTFDSWENLNPAENPIIIAMLQALAKEMVTKEKIIRVTIGTGGKTPPALKEQKLIEDPEKILTGIKYEQDSAHQVNLYYDEQAHIENMPAIEKSLVDILGKEFVSKNKDLSRKLSYNGRALKILSIVPVQEFLKNIITASNSDALTVEQYIKIFDELEEHLSGLSPFVWKCLQSKDPGQVLDTIDLLKSLLDIVCDNENVPVEISNDFIQKTFSLQRENKTHRSEMQTIIKSYKAFVELKLYEDKQAEPLAKFLLEPRKDWTEESKLIPAMLEKFNRSKFREDDELRLAILKFPSKGDGLIKMYELISQFDTENFKHLREFLLYGNIRIDKRINLLRQWLDAGLQVLLAKEHFSSEKRVFNIGDIISKIQKHRLPKHKLEDLFKSLKEIMDSNLPNSEWIISMILKDVREAQNIANLFLSIHKIGPVQYAEFTRYVNECKTYDPIVGQVLAKLHEDKILIQNEGGLFSFVLNLSLEQLRCIDKNYSKINEMQDFLASSNMQSIIGDRSKERLQMYEFLLSHFSEFEAIRSIFTKEPIKNPENFMESLFREGHPAISKISDIIKRHNQLHTLGERITPSSSQSSSQSEPPDLKQVTNKEPEQKEQSPRLDPSNQARSTAPTVTPSVANLGRSQSQRDQVPLSGAKSPETQNSSFHVNKEEAQKNMDAIRKMLYDQASRYRDISRYQTTKDTLEAIAKLLARANIISIILEGGTIQFSENDRREVGLKDAITSFKNELDKFKDLTKKDRSNRFTFIRTSQKGQTKGEELFFESVESSLKELSQNVDISESLAKKTSEEIELVSQDSYEDEGRHYMGI